MSNQHYLEGAPVVCPTNSDLGNIEQGTVSHEREKSNSHILGDQNQMPNSGKTRERVKEETSAWQLVGHWNSDERKKYHWFLELHHSHFQNKQMRRMDKIFKSMAAFIGSRAADQCRSHHQKMQKKHKSFYNIIQSLRVSHYKSTRVDDMVSQLQFRGIPVKSTLIDPVFLGITSAETRHDLQNAKQEEPVDLTNFYNFFGEREIEFVDPLFEGLTP